MVSPAQLQTTWYPAMRMEDNISPKEDSHTPGYGVTFQVMCFLATRKGGPVKYILVLLLLVTAGCTAHPYTVCRGEDYCTPAFTHEEAIRASELKKTWHDEKLYVRPVRNKEGS